MEYFMYFKDCPAAVQTVFFSNEEDLFNATFLRT